MHTRPENYLVNLRDGMRTLNVGVKTPRQYSYLPVPLLGACLRPQSLVAIPCIHLL